MRRWLSLLLIALALSIGASQARPLGGQAGSSPPPADQMTALLATLCNNCWGDAGAFVTTAPTLNSVVWNCTSSCPGGGPLASTIHANTGPSAIMSSWSSAVFDSINNQLVVWGGGHSDYWGNEVYAFSTTSLTWSRLTVPATPPGDISTVEHCNFGTQPSSMHTYGGPTFVGTGSGKMFTSNGAASGPNGNGCQLSWLLDLGTLTWTQVSNTLNAGGPGFIDAWESSASQIDVASEDSLGFEIFPTNGSGSPFLRGGAQLDDFHMSGAVDPVDHLMVNYSGLSGHIEVINTTTGVKTTPTTTGGTARTCETSTSVASAGIAWDSAISKFIAWCGNAAGAGGAQLYTLTPVTWVWAQIGPGVGNAVTPTAPQGNGTWGRFNYDPVHNAAVLVNDITEHVWVFKLVP